MAPSVAAAVLVGPKMGGLFTGSLSHDRQVTATPRSLNNQLLNRASRGCLRPASPPCPSSGESYRAHSPWLGPRPRWAVAGAQMACCGGRKSTAPRWRNGGHCRVSTSAMVPRRQRWGMLVISAVKGGPSLVALPLHPKDVELCDHRHCRPKVTLRRNGHGSATLSPRSPNCYTPPQQTDYGAVRFSILQRRRYLPSDGS